MGRAGTGGADLAARVGLAAALAALAAVALAAVAAAVAASVAAKPTVPRPLQWLVWTMVMRLLLPAALLGTLLPAAHAGTPGVDEPPVASAPRSLTLPVLQERTLANGLAVVVAPRPGLPVVSATLLVRAGAEADPPDKPGLAVMTTNLWPKGALRNGRPVPATDLARQAEALGSGLDTSSGWGASTLSMTVSSPRLGEALALMADVLRRPVLAEAELERARAQTLDGLRVTLGNPSEVAGLALRRSFWGDSAYGRVTTPASVQRLRRADLQAFQAQWVRPDRVALLLVGDITPEHGQALAQRLLGDWRAPTTPAPQLSPAAPAPAAAALLLIDMPGSGQSGVAVAAPYLGDSTADRRARYIGALASAVLGGGYSARLNQEVRIKRGLSYGASAGAESQASGGMFSARAQTNHPTAAEVLQLLRSEITRLADAPPAADELAARQATLVGAFARRLETTAGLSAQLVAQIAHGRPLAELADYAPGVLAVTPAQVQAFARQHWAAGGLRAVVAGDLAAAGSSLTSLAAPAQRVPLAQLDLEQAGLRKTAKP